MGKSFCQSNKNSPLKSKVEEIIELFITKNEKDHYAEVCINEESKQF